jgi:hypothetical protein
VTALIPSIMERTLLFNFPASLRDVRNWQHLGDVAILANVHFAPHALVTVNRGSGLENALLDLHVLELVDKNPNVFAVIDWNDDQVQPAKGKCLLQRRH